MSSDVTICILVYAFLLGVCIRARLLCHMVWIQTAFTCTAKQFSQVAVPISSLTRSMRVPVILSLYLVLTVFSFLM